MKDVYTIHFDEPKEFTCKVKRLTNALRAQVLKLGDLTDIPTDVEKLNAFLALVLDPVVDFSEATPSDTDEVVSDFFLLFSQKTS